MGKLEGKVAIVTGASNGIGKATALALATEGASVVVNYLSSPDRAEAVAKEIQTVSGRAIVWKADVSVGTQVDAMIQGTLDEFHRIDILVNNAGITIAAPIEELTEDIWDSVVGVHLKGTYLCSRAVIPTMLHQKAGRIINISSMAGLFAIPHSPHYAAAKAGVIGFTRSIADWLGPEILVNCIAPGGVDTQAIVGTDEFAPILAKERAHAPLRRRAKPEEIADVVMFLATGGNFITGQVLVVDGGLGNSVFGNLGEGSPG